MSDVCHVSPWQISQAAAVFILANRQADRPNEEDSANIMRATAVKNISPKIRIIIQLLNHQNKVSSVENTMLHLKLIFDILLSVLMLLFFTTFFIVVIFTIFIAAPFLFSSRHTEATAFRSRNGNVLSIWVCPNLFREAH